MSYTVMPYLVDLTSLQSVYGCRDGELLTHLEQTNASALEWDETPRTVWVARPGLPMTQEVQPALDPTLRQALAAIIAGSVPAVDDGSPYWYALERICGYVGTPLPNEPLIGIRSRGVAVLEGSAVVRDMVTASRQPLPFPLPPPLEFPVISYITRDEAAAVLARLPIVDLGTPFEDAWETWDDQTRQAWTEEWPQRVQVQYRRWLDEARRTGTDVITFFY